MGPARGKPFRGISALGYCEWAELFAGHLPFPDAKIDLYITRDGKSVLESVYRATTYGKISFSEFLTRKSMDLTQPQRWWSSVRAWKSWDGCKVRYEDLANPDTREDALGAVAERLKLDPDPMPAFNPDVLYGYPGHARVPIEWSEEDLRAYEAVQVDERGLW